MTTTATPTRVNRYGFPVVKCSRCSGTGAFGPKSVHGGVCFHCNGTGWVIRRGAAEKAWLAFLAANKTQRSPIVAQLAVGDRVRIYKGDDFRTVTHIEWIMKGRGEGLSTQGVEGDPRYVVSQAIAIDVMVTFDDGEVAKLSTRQIITRAGKVDPAPFVEGLR